MEKIFSVEEGIAIQQGQLRHWKKILTTKAFEDLCKYAERNNTTAKDGYEIIRGTNLSVFLSNYSQNCNDDFEVKPTKTQKGWIKQAKIFLCFVENESNQAVLNVIRIIHNHENQDDTVDVALSENENVFVCEEFEFNFTCKSFLKMIGYN